MRHVFRPIVPFFAIALGLSSATQAQRVARDTTPMLLVPARVFDAPAGVNRDGWVVLVRGNRIAAVGPRERVTVPPSARQIGRQVGSSKVRMSIPHMVMCGFCPYSSTTARAAEDCSPSRAERTGHP